MEIYFRSTGLSGILIINQENKEGKISIYKIKEANAQPK
jgi:hypothetical protein